MKGARREYLFEDFSEEELRRRVSSTTVREAGEATTVTSTTQKVLEVAIASGEQLRVYGYRWYQADPGPTRARVQAFASTGAWSSIVDRDYLDSPGRAANEGVGWEDPYLTVGMHAEGSLTFIAEALSSGAQASIDRVGVTVRGKRRARLDEAHL